MTEQELREFHDSFDRCMRNRRFFDLFYDSFLRSSPEVASKFQATDFRHQKRALKMSLYVIQGAAARRQPHYGDLDDVARRHSRAQADIQPGLYDLWLDTLVETVARCDRHYTTEVGNVWRAALRPAISYMVARY